VAVVILAYRDPHVVRYELKQVFVGGVHDGVVPKLCPLRSEGGCDIVALKPFNRNYRNAQRFGGVPAAADMLDELRLVIGAVGFVSFVDFVPEGIAFGLPSDHEVTRCLPLDKSQQQMNIVLKGRPPLPMPRAMSEIRAIENMKRGAF
jgi:hypothetical protein